MHASGPPGLSITCVRDDADLEAMIAVRSQTDPANPPPKLENLRHNLDRNDDLTYLVARLGTEPVGCGFVHTWPPEHAGAHLIVVPQARRRGIGTALLADLGARARDAGKDELEGEARADDAESILHFERRGYRVVGGEQAVALDLAQVEGVAVEPPAGIRIVPHSEDPNVLRGLYEVSVEAEEDIPGSPGVRSYEQWLSEIDRPGRRADLCFVALAGDEVVGSAVLEGSGRDAYHGLTAVKRVWRRRGVAEALKRSQMLAAKAAGFERLVTESEERNLPMRRLNEKLGYRPEPSLSTVVLRGPAEVRLPDGDG